MGGAVSFVPFGFLTQCSVREFSCPFTASKQNVDFGDGGGGQRERTPGLPQVRTGAQVSSKASVPVPFDLRQRVRRPSSK